MDNYKDLSGDWEIKISQKIKDEALTYSLFCSLSQMGYQVIGLMVFDLDRIGYKFTSVLKDNRTYNIQLQGKVEGSQLMMQYANLQPEIKQFGYLISQIASPDRMNGVFIGFGPESEGLISGEMHFSRV